MKVTEEITDIQALLLGAQIATLEGLHKLLNIHGLEASGAEALTVANQLKTVLHRELERADEMGQLDYPAKDEPQREAH